MNDADLGMHFRHGDARALEEVISRYGEPLLRYITAILCDYHEAEDIAQEVFVAAYQHRASFDGSNLSAWLYKIAHNLSMNRLKKRKLFYFEVLSTNAAAPPPDAGLGEDTLRALRQLRPHERAVLYARIMQEQSYEELSRISGKSPAALRKQYERAKKKLAQKLKAENPHRFRKEQHNECTRP